MQRKVILFDLDDTLYDHAHSSREGLRAIQAHHDALVSIPLEVLVKEFRAVLEATHLRVLAGDLSPDEARVERLQAILRRHQYEPSAAEILDLVECYRRAYVTGQRPVPGSARVLKGLRSLGAGIGIVTNNFTEEQWKKLRICSLDSLIDFMVTAESVGVAKPHPAIFRAALNRAGVPPCESVMVGDSWDADVMGARKLGLSAVWFNREKPNVRGGSAVEHLTGYDDRVAVLHNFENEKAAVSTIINLCGGAAASL